LSRQVLKPDVLTKSKNLKMEIVIAGAKSPRNGFAEFIPHLPARLGRDAGLSRNDTVKIIILKNHLIFMLKISNLTAVFFNSS